MKNILKFCIILSFTIFCSCVKDFDDLNTNPKVLTIDELNQSAYPLVIKRAFYSGIYSDDVMSFLRGHAAFADIYSNYQAHTHPDFYSDRYTFNGSWLDVFYTGFYSGVAVQIKYSEDYAVENGFEIENAISKIWKVYVYHKITDYWGPIIYSNFGNGEKTVLYDSQEDVYKSFFVTLDEATTLLKNHAGETSFLGTGDVVYSGQVNSWLKFANTLRLRLALRVKYVEPSLAKSEAEKAVGGGVIENNVDNGYVKVTTDFPNRYNTITAWSDFRMSADMESILKGYQDPRTPIYYSPAATPDPADDPVNLLFPYEGMRNGQSRSDKQGAGFNAKCSNMGPTYLAVGVKGNNWPLFRASEAYFLRAEGVLEGWNMGGGTVQSFYNKGIEASFAENGLDTKDLSGNDYVTSTKVPMGYNSTSTAVSTIPVLFDVTANKEKQLEQIITQKWIALYPDSEEAWAERRRTGYPSLYYRLESDNLDIPVDKIPRRVPFVGVEYNTNRKAVEDAAANLLGGPDNGATRLWWDKKN